MATNAILNALPGFVGKTISGARVPDLSQLVDGSSEFTAGTSKLVAWLRQQGFSDNQINAKTPLEWNRLKIEQFDFGIGLRTAAASVAETIGIPTTAAGWVQLAAEKALPGGKTTVAGLKLAWKHFSESMSLSQRPGQDIAELDQTDPSVRNVFGQFVDAYIRGESHAAASELHPFSHDATVEYLQQLRGGMLSAAQLDEMDQFADQVMNSMSPDQMSWTWIDMIKKNFGSKDVRNRASDFMREQLKDMSAFDPRKQAGYIELMRQNPGDTALINDAIELGRFLDSKNPIGSAADIAFVLQHGGDDPNSDAYKRAGDVFDEWLEDVVPENPSVEATQLLIRGKYDYLGTDSADFLSEVDKWFADNVDAGKGIDGATSSLITGTKVPGAAQTGAWKGAADRNISLFSKETTEYTETAWQRELRRQQSLPAIDPDMELSGPASGLTDPNQWVVQAEAWNESGLEQTADSSNFMEYLEGKYGKWWEEDSPVGHRALSEVQEYKEIQGYKGIEGYIEAESGRVSEPLGLGDGQLDDWLDSYQKNAADFHVSPDELLNDPLEIGQTNLTTPLLGDGYTDIDQAMGLDLLDDPFAASPGFTGEDLPILTDDMDVRPWYKRFWSPPKPLGSGTMPPELAGDLGMPPELGVEMTALKPYGVTDIGPQETPFLPQGKFESFDVSTIDQFAEHGVENLRMYSAEPGTFNADHIIESVANDESFWSKFKANVFTKDMAIWAGTEAVSAGASFLAGMGVNALLHNSDEWMVMNAMMIPLGAVGALGTIAMTISQTYGADYFKRQIERVYQTDAQLNKLCYIRSGDQWVPAIATQIGHPQEAATFLNAYGIDQNWQGAAWVRYETGLGLTVDANGDFQWQAPGRRDHLIMRQTDIDWGTTLDDQENWKPWLQAWFPDPDVSERLFKSGMYDTIDARPTNEVYGDLDSSNEFRSTVELIHMLHDNHIIDPMYESTLGPDYKWKDKHHEFFTDTARDDRGYSFWRNMPSASNLAWDMEENNPDNFYEWKMQGNHANQADALVSYFSDEIQRQYDALSDYSKAELANTRIGAIPDTAVGLQKFLQEQGARTDLTIESKQFRIAQAQALFVERMGSRIFPGGPSEKEFGVKKYDKDFGDIANQDMMLMYKQAEDYYRDYHPRDTIANWREGGPRYQTLFGDSSHAHAGWYDTNPWGVKEQPKMDSAPTLHEAIQSNVKPTQFLFSRAFVGALEQDSGWFHHWGQMFHDDDKTADAVVVTGTDPLVVVPDEVAATGVDKWIYFQGEKLLNPEYVEPVQQQTQTQTQTQPTATDTGLANISGGFGATGESLADAGLSVADG